MENYDSHISVDLKFLNRRGALNNFLFNTTNCKYITNHKYDYDIFCWLLNDGKLKNMTDLVFYGNKSDENNIISIPDGLSELVTLEDGVKVWTDAHFNLYDCAKYNQIIFSVGLFEPDLSKVNFEFSMLHYSIVNRKKIVHQKGMEITSKGSFFDFCELKRINNKFVVLDTFASEYNTFEKALKNRLYK